MDRSNSDEHEESDGCSVNSELGIGGVEETEVAAQNTMTTEIAKEFVEAGRAPGTTAVTEPLINSKRSVAVVAESDIAKESVGTDVMVYNHLVDGNVSLSSW